MEASRISVSYRRIGTILVEMEVITQTQLDGALAEQRHTGRLLGEILVSGYSVSRVDLADALAAQWEEAQTMSEIDEAQGAYHDDGAVDPLAEGDLSVLLEEAQAARAELTARTDELSRRVASLEALVVGVSDALDELRGAPPRGAQQAGPRLPRRGRSRTTHG